MEKAYIQTGCVAFFFSLRIIASEITLALNRMRQMRKFVCVLMHVISDLNSPTFKRRYVLHQRLPTCGSRSESGSREPSKWVAKTIEKNKNKTFRHKPGEYSANSRAFLDFRHDMDYTAILHIMEYRRIWSIAVKYFRLWAINLFLLCFAKKTFKKIRATAHQIVLANRSPTIFILVSGSRLAKGWEPLFYVYL